MKTITKKLGDEIFVWDPNAFDGKGYWFVLGTKGGYGRLASKKERTKLGVPSTTPPDDQSKAKVTPIDPTSLKKSVEPLIKDTMSEETKANATGMKDTFKPSNVTNNQVTNALYTKVSDGQRPRLTKGDSVSNVLGKIYNLMKQYHEEDVKRLVQEQRDRVRKEDDEKIYHDKLIQAITGKKKKGGSKVAPMATKDEKTPDIFDSIKDTLKNMVLNTLEDYGIFKLLGKSAAPIAAEAAGLGAAEAAAGAGAAKAAAAPAAAEAAAVGEGITATEVAGSVAVAGLGAAAGVALALVSPWVASAKERRKIEKNPNAPEYKDNPYAMKVRGEVKTEEEGAAKNIKKGMKQYKRPEIEQAVADKNNDDETLKAAYGENRAGLKTWLKEHPAPFSMYQAPSDVKPTTLQKVGSETSTAAAGRGSAKSAAMDPRRVDMPKQAAGATTGGGASVGGMHGVSPEPKTSIPMETPSATPTPPVANPLGQQAVASTQQNNQLKIDQNTTSKTTVINNSKNVRAGGGSTSETITTDSVPVRNDEDTWLKLQKFNFRPV